MEIILKVLMAFFVSATTATAPKTSNSKTIAIAYAVLLTVFAFTQLFWFEKFPALIEEHRVRYHNKHVAFMTLLEEV